jgi:cytochrome P450
VGVGTAGELSTLALFEGCSTDDLERVAQSITDVRRVPAGDTVCAEGDKADRWWIVVDGLADVTMDGLYLGTIGPGETIGELALLDGEPRAATVTAASDMVLEEVRGEDFLEALLSSPRLSLAILREVAGRLRTANALPRSAPERVAAGRISAPPSTPAVTQLDPSAEGYYADPYRYLDALRSEAPVHWSEALSCFVVLRYEDVLRLSRNKALLGSITTGDVPEPPAEGEPVRLRRPDKMMIRRDGADHTRLRRLVTKVFTPRAIDAWRAKAEEIVEQRLALAADRGEVDLIADYALPLPAQIISEMLGVPEADNSQLREWSQILVRNLEPSVTEEERQSMEVAVRAMLDYLEALVVDKRKHPSSDIITDLILAEEAGDCLDDGEIQAQIMLLYIAGHETTVNLIGNGVVALFRHREQLDLLRATPELDANAVEEVLRFESPAQFTRRRVLEPLVVGDVEIPGGTILTLGLSAANRDPAKWGEDAGRLEVARPHANEQLSFGGGPHFCLGAALARLEAQIALPRLVRRFPHLTLTSDEPDWYPRMILRGLRRLPARTVA